MVSMNISGLDDQAAQAAASLEVLLKNDRRLAEFGLTGVVTSPDVVAFPYAAALMGDVGDEYESMEGKQNTQERAGIALKDVERKLALVESLAVKLSRTSPEAIAGHLLRLHGYSVSTDSSDSSAREEKGDVSDTAVPSNVTLPMIRDRADRLERQAETLESVAKRVENSLTRGLTKMESATLRLSRVLTLSSTLKRIMRLQFETSKLQTYDLDDLRDLTRAAASVAVLEDLLDVSGSATNATLPRADNLPDNLPSLEQHVLAVERMRPEAVETAAAVRQAAAALLNDVLKSATATSNVSDADATQVIQQLGATLQVYFHLGELHEAVWKIVDLAHSLAETASRQLYSSVTLVGLNDKAKRVAKDARNLQKKLIQVRADAAQEWANGVLVAAMLVRNLNRVLCRKTDHVRRQLYMDVVAAMPVPSFYSDQAITSGLKDTNISTFLTYPTFPLFQLFWLRFCHSVSVIVETVLDQDNGRFRDDVAALYPTVRTAALGLVSHLQQSKINATVTNASPYYDELSFAATASGILGGSSILEDDFLHCTTIRVDEHSGLENPQSAASWTRSLGSMDATNATAQSSTNRVVHPSTSVLSSGIHSFEWKCLAGDGKNSKTGSGMYLLQNNFLSSCQERLSAPLQLMFPGHDISLESDKASINSGHSLLPSKYDIQRFDETIRAELAMADSREGGGDLSLVTMIAETVVNMIADFCVRAKNAMSGVNGEHAYVMEDLSMTTSLEHDRKLVSILYAVRNYLEQAPEKTYIAPYRPAVLPRHQEAATLCQEALAQALSDIDQTVKQVVVLPLCRALNHQVASVLARISHGVYIYIESREVSDDSTPGFVQTSLNPVFEKISKIYLSKFPPLYASVVAERIVSFSIYCYISNMSLVRPLGEAARLHITQDLADLEMALELLVSATTTGGSISVHHAEQGKPYGELRAVRQMLYWSGLEGNKDVPATEISKALLRELWIKDIRPSTVFHYLFSYGPSLLSSPHHAKRIKAEDYVSTLVPLDGVMITDGEDSAWMTIMACCDSYQQRASSSSSAMDGDPRIAQIVLSLGQELLRRKRN